MPIARYVAMRALASLSLAAVFFGIAVAIRAVVIEHDPVFGAVVGFLGAFLFAVISPFALVRRARVYEDAFVPMVVPLSERFRMRTRLITLKEISEIRNQFNAANIMDGLGFETNDGKRYFVTEGGVGKAAFQEFLNLKHRFYS